MGHSEYSSIERTTVATKSDTCLQDIRIEKLKKRTAQLPLLASSDTARVEWTTRQPRGQTMRKFVNHNASMSIPRHLPNY